MSDDITDTTGTEELSNPDTVSKGAREQILLGQYTALRAEAVQRIEMRGRRVTRAFLSAISFLVVAFLSGEGTPINGISSGLIVALSPLAFVFFYFEEMRSERVLTRLGYQLDRIEKEFEKDLELSEVSLRWEQNFGGQADENFRQRFPAVLTLLSGLSGYLIFAGLGLFALGWSPTWPPSPILEIPKNANLQSIFFESICVWIPVLSLQLSILLLLLLLLLISIFTLFVLVFGSSSTVFGFAIIYGIILVLAITSYWFVLLEPYTDSEDRE